MDLLENEILEYETKGFKIVQRRKLRHGLRVYLERKRKGWGSGSDGVYLYYVDGSASADSIRECLKDYVKFYEEEDFDNGDKSFFLCSTVNEELFRKMKKAKIEDDKIRNSIKPIVLERTVGKATEEEASRTIKEKKRVFIVHGREKAPAFELARILEREFKLETTLLQEQPHGGRTLIEKLEDYSNVGYAFVIVTPDDVGGLKGEELRERPRQNVILEWGHFIAKIGRNKTCILLKGNIELPSDMQGVGYYPFNDSVEEVFLKIKRELRNAGLIN